MSYNYYAHPFYYHVCTCNYHALVRLAIKSLSNTTLGTSVNSLVFTCSVVPVLSDPSGPALHWAGLLLSLQRCSVLWHTCVVILHVSLTVTACQLRFLHDYCTFLHGINPTLPKRCHGRKTCGMHVVVNWSFSMASFPYLVVSVNLHVETFLTNNY